MRLLRVAFILDAEAFSFHDGLVIANFAGYYRPWTEFTDQPRHHHVGAKKANLLKAGLIHYLVYSGGWIRTNDLRVMGPTSFRCSTPR